MSKLLLVDDDVELTELLSSLLTLEGFEVETANNGLEALQKLDESHELVLLDVMMPKLNGLDTLKEIRCNQSLKMRNKETNRDLAEFFGNKRDEYR